MIRRSEILGAALALPLVWGIVGCGGKKTDTPPIPVVKEESKPAAETPKGDDTKPAEPAGAAAEGWGSIKGRIVWTGDVPDMPPIIKKGDMNAKDPAVCAVQDVPNEEVVVNKENKGLQWVAVWLGGKPKVHDDLAKAEGTAELGQQYCQFIPHMLIMRKGQKFVISSNDPIAHNTKGDPFKSPGFNPTVPPAPADGKTQLDGPELDAETRPFAISCSIHPWMKAHMHVLDHPYYAVTDENGAFEIEKVPAGAQKLVIWHDKGWGEGLGKGKDITVKAGETTDLGEISYSPPK